MLTSEVYRLECKPQVCSSPRGVCTGAAQGRVFSHSAGPELGAGVPHDLRMGCDLPQIVQSSAMSTSRTHEFSIVAGEAEQSAVRWLAKSALTPKPEEQRPQPEGGNVTNPTRVDSAANDTAAIPIVLGVVGHIDPAPDAKNTLESSLRWVFELMRSRYKNSPIEVLSSLAEGADQIVADVALEMGCSVRVPLPFPSEVYAHSSSFRSPESRAHFLSLLDDARVASFVVPLPEDLEPRDQAGWEAIRDDHTGRGRCYANAGGYIVRHCAVLIALWDGEEGEPSGTAEMVRYMSEGKIPECYPWRQYLRSGSDTGPVVAIQTPRKGRDYKEKPKPGTVNILVPPDGKVLPRKMWKRPPGAWRWLFRRLSGTLGLRFGSRSRNEFWKFREMLRNIDEFNRDVRMRQTSQGRDHQRSDVATLAIDDVRNAGLLAPSREERGI